MEKNNLIVGLGGSGGKIIRNIRKTLERNKTTQVATADPARFEFLYVDTSSDELDKREEWKVLGKEVDLDRSQYLINTASNVRPVLDDPRSFPGLMNWIEPRNIFDFVKPGIAGAAQRRKLGRVVFAQNAARFVKAVEDRLHLLEQRSAHVGAVIHVVCGLAGGTGGGSVVDAVAQIRHRFPDEERYRILVYALLPEKNSTRVREVSGSSPYYANGYAALAELNALAVGGYEPVNLLDGTRLKHDVYFNGCYLIHNVNENSFPFDVEFEVPRIVADFIYQKALNEEWDGLHRAEQGENNVRNFETEDAEKKTRSKLFLSFGMKRVVVPEQEIKEYLAYGFAEQATRQLMFNNFRQGEGYADETIEKDWGSEARRPEVLQAFLLSDVHLTLETGILDDDARNSHWKPAHEFWKQVTGVVALEVADNDNLEETNWTHVLNTRLAKVFDDTYRMAGGVRKFYEIKGNARPEMARHIVRHIERDLFSRWKIGAASLSQLRKLVDALVQTLEEKLTLTFEAIAKGPAAQVSIQRQLADLTMEFDTVTMLERLMKHRRRSLFADIVLLHQNLYTLNTKLEGQKFAASLIPFVIEQLVGLRGAIDQLHQTLALATEKVNEERAARLGAKDAAYQKRIFDLGAIGRILKALIVDEAAQAARTQKVRQSIIELAGTEVGSFDKLMRSLSLSSVIATLSQVSATIVELAHAELAKTMTPVLHVNIVERLQKQYDANPSALKMFVSNLYEESGTMLQFSKTELDKSVQNNAGGASGAMRTTGVFLPECESQKEFRAALAGMFVSQKDPASDTAVRKGGLPNEIVIMKIVSLMPVRFVESLPYLKKHYVGLLGDHGERHLLHGEGDGRNLPSLFSRSAAELQVEERKKPYRLLAHLTGILKKRENKITGMPEWALVYTVDGLPEETVLSGSGLAEILDVDHPDAVQVRIEKEVAKRIATDYQHKDEKEELLEQYRKLVRKRYEEVGETVADDYFQALSKMRGSVREIIGLSPGDEQSG